MIKLRQHFDNEHVNGKAEITLVNAPAIAVAKSSYLKIIIIKKKMQKVWEGLCLFSHTFPKSNIEHCDGRLKVLQKCNNWVM